MTKNNYSYNVEIFSICMGVAYKIKITLFTFWVINYNYMPHEKIHRHSVVIISV